VTSDPAPINVTATSVDEIPVGTVSFGDDGRVIHANTALLTLLGYARDEVEGRHVEQLLSVAGRIFFQTHLYPLVRLGQPAKELFVLLRHKDGRQIGTLVNASRTGQTTTCAMMEVLERSKFEEALLRAKRDAEERGHELEEANARLEEQALELEFQQDQLHEQAEDLDKARAAAVDASNAKSHFLAVMSHELRTPLNAIGGYAELLDLDIHGPLNEGQRDTLHRLVRAQKHLLRLINDVLSMSRIEAGHVEYRVENVDAAQLVDSVVPMIEPQLISAGLQSTVTLEPGLRLRADQEKLQQILINLLTNAVKFTPPDGTISLKGSRRDAKTASIVIRDTGIGMPADKLQSIFEPFVQVQTGQARREGTGLGLAISRDLARGMGGDIIVESEQGKGSAFHVVLPLATG
jgi:PAS domain S-box-containing protein